MTFDSHGGTAMTKRWEGSSCELRQVVARLTVRGVRHIIRKSALGFPTISMYVASSARHPTRPLESCGQPVKIVTAYSNVQKLTLRFV